MRDILNKEEIKKLGSLGKIGVEILCFDEIDSTNSEAKRKHTCPDGSVFIADVQTDGKGRRGRQWVSEAEKGIWMSILLKPEKNPDKIPQITLAAGLAVCNALGKFGVDTGIKWPNDVVVSGKKVCGILAEACSEKDGLCVVVGMGINVNFENFPEEIKDVATSIFIQTGEKKRRSEIVFEILREFEKRYAQFLNGDMGKIICDYKKECVSLGKKVKVILPDDEFEAFACDINEEGEIIVIKDGEKIPLNSGEVSVRGMLGYI